MSQQYGVSRSTIRHVISELVAAGLVVVLHRRRTFVRSSQSRRVSPRSLPIGAPYDGHVSPPGGVTAALAAIPFRHGNDHAVRDRD